MRKVCQRRFVLIPVLLIILATCGTPDSTAPPAAIATAFVTRTPRPTATAVSTPTRALASGRVSDTTIPAPPGGVAVTADDPGLVGNLVGSLESNLSSALDDQGITIEKQEAFTTSASMAEIVDFYKAEMAQRGWNLNPSGEQTVANQQTIMVFDAGNQAAMIMIMNLAAMPTGEGTLVFTTNASQ